MSKTLERKLQHKRLFLCILHDHSWINNSPVELSGLPSLLTGDEKSRLYRSPAKSSEYRRRRRGRRQQEPGDGARTGRGGGEGGPRWLAGPGRQRRRRRILVATNKNMNINCQKIDNLTFKSVLGNDVNFYIIEANPQITLLITLLVYPH